MKTIATRQKTMALLEDYALKAKKKYGQNFIIDPGTIERIVRIADLDKETTVIEIGPGLGALTQGLLQEAKQVIAYDIDPDVLAVLKDNLPLTHLELVHEDFLKVDLASLIKQLQPKKLKIVSNLPYYITTPLIEKITLASEGIDEAILMVQKEVAQKYCDPQSIKDRQPLHYLLDELATVSYRMTVRKAVFYPAPHVDSAILSLTFHHQAVDEGFYAFLQTAFQARRKTLYNNLKQRYAPERLLEVMAELSLKPELRADQLNSQLLRELYERLTSSGF